MTNFPSDENLSQKPTPIIPESTPSTSSHGHTYQNLSSEETVPLLDKIRMIGRRFQALVALVNPRLLSKGATASVVSTYMDEVLSKMLQEGTLHVPSSIPPNFFKAHAYYTQKLSARERADVRNVDEPLDVKLTADRQLDLLEFDALKQGDCMLFSADTQHHQMTGMIVAEKDGSFTYYHHNSGEGLDEHPHHYKEGRFSEKGKVVFQHAAVYSFSDSASMRSFISSQSRRSEDAKDVYAKIIQCGGKRIDREDIPYQSTQKGGSCTAGAEKALLCRVFGEDGFQTIKNQLISMSGTYLFSLISEGRSLSIAEKVNALEMVHALKGYSLINQSLLAKTHALLVKPKTDQPVNSELVEKYRSAEANYSKDHPSFETGLEMLTFFLARGDFNGARKVLLELYGRPVQSFLILEPDILDDLQQVVPHTGSLNAIDARSGVIALLQKQGLEETHLTKGLEAPEILEKIAETLNSPWKEAIQKFKKPPENA